MITAAFENRNPVTKEIMEKIAEAERREAERMQRRGKKKVEEVKNRKRISTMMVMITTIL